MGTKRLENAVNAAGYAMVNPDDFAREDAPVPQQSDVTTAAATAKPQLKSWLNWEYLRLSGGKATA